MKKLEFGQVFNLTFRLVEYLKLFVGDDIYECLGVDVNESRFDHTTPEIKLCAEQADAFIDITYYIFNSLVKVGDLYFLLKTDTEKMYKGVIDFTTESTNTTFPKNSRPMTKGEKLFITKMILSEVCELFDTVVDNGLSHLKSIVKVAGAKEGGLHAIVDLCMTACEEAMDINFEKVFMVVHNANMAKRNPTTLKFERREDGKILKPEGWQAPDIEKFLIEN